MNYVCDERIWNRVLSFSIFSNRVKRNLKNDLEIFLYLKFRFHLFVFFNHSLYSVFLHFCLCKKTCDQKKSSECYCQFCSRNYPYIFDNVNAFQNIIIDKQDFALKFNKFFQKSSLFSLGVCHNHALFIDPRKAKIYKYAYLRFIRSPNKLFQSFLSILIRMYINLFFSQLNKVEVNLKETQFISFREQIWIFASNFMYGFCLYVENNYFNRLFHNMRFSEEYTAVCYRILNKHSVSDRILCEHDVVGLSESYFFLIFLK